MIMASHYSKTKVGYAAFTFLCPTADGNDCKEGKFIWIHSNREVSSELFGPHVLKQKSL